MSGKFDLARMLREIEEEKSTRSGQNRALTQEEIKRLIAQRKKHSSAHPEAPAKT